ncbi:uncharacterized protein [Gossypium hirsutum]|uniref:Retrovirus-related Pol polyprotein from transposon TNT 1-94-like beta-barrel domain-containing protein n=1 Tax=Gossypium hirsutum TaxID=3635 RepID=A0ABM2YNL0_GOSHI|nr:uncharacterized protein LOC121206024 [Gossypium hirsutum]
MACETPKEAWDKLKEEFQGTERTRQQQLLNLRRDFENLKMKEEETVKQYSDRIMAVARRTGEISQRMMLQGAMTSPADIARGQVIQKTDAGSDQMQTKPRQSQYQQPKVEAQVAEDSSDQEEQVFAVSCLAAEKKCSKGWLLDSGCTNHMSPDATIFKTLDRTCKTKVKIGNGQFIKAEGKGDVQIYTPTGIKVISNVLLVPEIDRNLLSIAQLLEKGYSVVFKQKECQIFIQMDQIS